MNLIKSTLQHKVVEPGEGSGSKPPLLILLHGRGANEDDLLGLTEYLDQRFFFVAARAPFAFQGGGGYTWYDLLEIGKPEPKMFSESYERLVRFCDDVKRGYPVDPLKTFLLGFSMGTIMSYALALTLPGTARGVLANSGYIPEESGLTFQWDKIGGVSFFTAHGLYDPVIPVAFSRRSRELLERAKVDLSYREYDMGHQISEESLGDMATWLTGKLNLMSDRRTGHDAQRR